MQVPPTAIVRVTVYVPPVLADKSILPVLVLSKTKPAVEENTSGKAPPVRVGSGSVPVLQNGEPI